MKPNQTLRDMRELRRREIEEEVEVLRELADTYVQLGHALTVGRLLVAARHFEKLLEDYESRESWWDWIATDFHCKENVQRLQAIDYEP